LSYKAQYRGLPISTTPKGNPALPKNQSKCLLNTWIACLHAWKASLVIQEDDHLKGCKQQGAHDMPESMKIQILTFNSSHAHIHHYFAAMTGAYFRGRY